MINNKETTLARSRIQHMAILLLPNFNVMATTSLIDPLRAANYLSGQHLYKWYFISVNGGQVIGSNGMSINTLPLNKLNVLTGNIEALIVSASWTPEAYQNKTILNALREWAGHGILLGGLDTGAFILGFAGLLNGYRATVHYEHIDAFIELFPKIDVSEDIFVIDRNRISCCGGSAAADLALELIGSQYGIDLANASARYIFHDRLRSASESQNASIHEPVGQIMPPRLREAIVTMERHLEETISISNIAAIVGISQRNMERLFKNYTHVTAKKYYLDIRLDRARGLLTQTQMPILEVAIACGFSSSQYFSRVYKKRFQISPQKDRIKGRVPFEFRAYPSYSGKAVVAN